MLDFEGYLLIVFGIALVRNVITRKTKNSSMMVNRRETLKSVTSCLINMISLDKANQMLFYKVLAHLTLEKNPWLLFYAKILLIERDHFHLWYKIILHHTAIRDDECSIFDTFRNLKEPEFVD